MADFCWDCVQKLGVDPKLNDLDRTGRGNYQYMALERATVEKLNECANAGWRVIAVVESFPHNQRFSVLMERRKP